MPNAIYISGLGQSTNKESVEKYAARYIKELEYSTSGINYYTKVEKIYYNDDQSCLAVRIYQHPKEQLKSDKDPPTLHHLRLRIQRTPNSKVSKQKPFIQKPCITTISNKKTSKTNY